MSEFAAAFDEHRGHLRLVAHRMLGSASEADDAVQEAWLKLMSADARSVENMRSWLTTVVARVCLDMLRARKARAEDPVANPPELSVAPGGTADRELADSIGLALLVVLDKLDPAERLAFVLHDLFAMPFDEIAALLGRSTAAARQLASRARRRVQGASAAEVDLPTQRRVVDAFIAALRTGDVEALVAVLDPDVVGRVDGVPSQIRGARQWATGAVSFKSMAEHMRSVLVDGRVALAFAPGGKVARVLVLGFAGATIREVEIVVDPEALAVLAIEDLA